MPVGKGTLGNDTLTGTRFDDHHFGLAGNDTLRGLGGADILEGGSGKDLRFADVAELDAQNRDVGGVASLGNVLKIDGDGAIPYRSTRRTAGAPRKFGHTKWAIA